MTAQYLYRKSDNRFLEGGFYDVQLPLIDSGEVDEHGAPVMVPDTEHYGIATFGDADLPDLRSEMFDAVLGKRPMTDEERDRFLNTPDTVSPLQFKAALLALGRLDEIEQVVAQADPLTQLAWREASVFSRTSPLLQQMGAALGFTDAEIDAIFRAAGTVTV